MSEPFQPSPPTGGSWDPSGPSGPRAGFWRRLAALLVDFLVAVVVGGVVVGILAVVDESLVGVGFAIGAIGFVVYQIYFHGSPSGQTVGKRALGIRVIDFRTGGPIGYGRAAIRYIGTLISGWICYLGYLWMLWDREKQTWHDKLANDVVVPTDAYPVERWP